MRVRKARGLRALTSYCLPWIPTYFFLPVTLRGRPIAPRKLLPERKPRVVSTILYA